MCFSRIPPWCQGAQRNLSQVASSSQSPNFKIHFRSLKTHFLRSWIKTWGLGKKTAEKVSDCEELQKLEVSSRHPSEIWSTRIISIPSWTNLNHTHIQCFFTVYVYVCVYSVVEQIICMVFPVCVVEGNHTMPTYGAQLQTCVESHRPNGPTFRQGSGRTSALTE